MGFLCYEFGGGGGGIFGGANFWYFMVYIYIYIYIYIYNIYVHDIRGLFHGEAFGRGNLSCSCGGSL